MSWKGGQTSAETTRKGAWLSSVALCAIRHQKLAELLPIALGKVSAAMKNLDDALRLCQAPDGNPFKSAEKFIKLD